MKFLNILVVLVQALAPGLGNLPANASSATSEPSQPRLTGSSHIEHKGIHEDGDKYRDGDEDEHEDEHEQNHEGDHEKSHGDKLIEEHAENYVESQESTHGDVHDGHEDEPEEGVVELSEDSLTVAGIKISILTMELIPEFISAPGEVQLDQYASAEVTPLVDAVIVKRHARLGDEVEAGQPLVTLASVDVAVAQGELKVGATEWQRIRNLGRTAVGARRYIEAEVAYEQARLKLSVYGLDEKQIEAVASQRLKDTLGQFQLNAPVPGTVLRDDFRVGQRIEAGQSLFLIADENRIWVEANLSPDQARNVDIGMLVRVKMGAHWHDGWVIQKHHLLEEQTRTVPVRIAVEPDNEHHHAGEFVQVVITLPVASGEPALVVSESALMRDDEGKWTVFVEFKAGHFKQTRIRRGRARGGKVPISGIAAGSSVVTEGAFYLAAELAKSGFDIHNH